MDNDNLDETRELKPLSGTPDTDTYVTEDAPDDVAIEVTRAEIETTRADIADTLDAIKEKLSPQNLVEQAKEHVSDAVSDAVSGTVDQARDAIDTVVTTAKDKVGGMMDTAKGAGANVVDTIRRNPLPAALAACGIAWLYMKNREENRSKSVV